jgi:hypothetical protein
MKTKTIYLNKTTTLNVNENDFLYYNDIITGKKELAQARVDYGFEYLFNHNKELYFLLLNKI